MKKLPTQRYTRESKRYPILATMAAESHLRKQAWLRHGCNAFDSKKKTSQPMSFWTNDDVLQYIKLNNLEIAPIYGEIIECEGKLKCSKYARSGCLGCAFGSHLSNDKNRYLQMKEYYPRLYDYVIGGGDWGENPYYNPDLPDEPNEIGWTPWNPPKIWKPNSKGLGYGKVFEMVNEIYGDDFIRY